MSEALLRKTWRKAVFAVWGDACILCGARPVSPHHVVKRRNNILKWDVQNGRPLCVDCHDEVERNVVKIPLTDYLRDLNKWDVKSWIAHVNQISPPYTKEMFYRDELEELQTAIKNPKVYRSGK